MGEIHTHAIDLDAPRDWVLIWAPFGKAWAKGDVQRLTDELFESKFISADAAILFGSKTYPELAVIEGSFQRADVMSVLGHDNFMCAYVPRVSLAHIETQFFSDKAET